MRKCFRFKNLYYKVLVIVESDEAAVAMMEDVCRKRKALDSDILIYQRKEIEESKASHRLLLAYSTQAGYDYGYVWDDRSWKDYEFTAYQTRAEKINTIL